MQILSRPIAPKALVEQVSNTSDCISRGKQWQARSIYRASGAGVLA